MGVGFKLVKGQSKVSRLPRKADGANPAANTAEQQLGPSPTLLARFPDYGMRYAKSWPDGKRKWATGTIPPDALVCVAISRISQLMGRFVDSQTPENASAAKEQINHLLSMRSYISKPNELPRNLPTNATK